MIKICVVCGKEFKCSPSDKKVTCSKECSRINKSRTHQGKRNIWSEENKEKLRQKGKTENLKKGTEAARRSPKSGRFETNVSAKIWKLTSPEGKVYIVKNLSNWARTNCSLFGLDENEANAQKIVGGLKHAKRGTEGKEYARTSQYKGWKSEGATEEDYRFYKYKDADLTALSEKQQECLIMRMNGLSIREIAQRCNIQRCTDSAKPDVNTAKNTIKKIAKKYSEEFGSTINPIGEKVNQKNPKIPPTDLFNFLFPLDFALILAYNITKDKERGSPQ